MGSHIPGRPILKRRAQAFGFVPESPPPRHRMRERYSVGHPSWISIGIDSSSHKCSHELVYADFPKPGQRCWAYFCGSYGLPTGLAERAPLTFVRNVDVRYLFRDTEGREWLLGFPQFDGTGYQYLDGERCNESHPRFVEWLRHLLAEKLAQGEPEAYSSIVHIVDGEIDRLRWRLVRNGHDPDQPPAGPCPRVTPGPRGRATPNPRLPVRSEGAQPRRMNS